MFPNPNYTPALFAERPDNEPVTGLVRRELFQPEFTIGDRQVRMFRAAMPKTTVNEHNDFLLGESKIGFSKHLHVPTPPGDFVLPKKSDENKFRILIGFAANTRHDL